VPISKAESPPGAHGGQYYCLDIDTRALVHGWQMIDE
jgi:hypothetical protein